MQSIEEIYRQHALTVFKYLMTLAHDRQLAEELTQETFYQAVRSIHRFDESCKITTWLCAIARNQYLAYLRKHPAMDEMDVLDAAGETHPAAEQDAMANVERMEMMKKLHACPMPYREILYLRLFGNLSFREIGDILGKTENWARVSFYRAKEKLRKEMEDDEK